MRLPPLAEPAAELTSAELRRYGRHLAIPEIGSLGQRRLKSATVLVVGAGGLGSPALSYLAAAGVGTLGVADFDTVEESNLQRQVIHGCSDVGRSKVVSARESLAELNPYVDVVIHEQRLEASNALDVLAPYDVVVDGSDNFATRYLLNDMCVRLGKPYVWGSVLRFDGQLSVFWAAHGPCYRCLHPQPPAPGTVPSCAEAGVLGVLCASIGAAQATEAIKLLTGVGEPLVGRLQLYDALAASWRELPLRKHPGCPVCGAEPTHTALGANVSTDASAGHADQGAISVQTLAEWLAARERGKRDFLLVDVREPYERDINQIPGSVLVPMGRFRAGPALDELPVDRQLVFYCKVGQRSAHVLGMVRAAGFDDAVHVAGGVSAWVADIDPSQPTY